MTKVVIYSTTSCGYCSAAKGLLRQRGIDFEEIDVSSDFEARARLVEKAEGRRTVPQIFIDDKPIGGFTDLRALDQSGQLAEMLSASSE